MTQRWWSIRLHRPEFYRLIRWNLVLSVLHVMRSHTLRNLQGKTGVWLRPARGDIRDLSRGSPEGWITRQKSILWLRRMCWSLVTSVSLWIILHQHPPAQDQDKCSWGMVVAGRKTLQIPYGEWRKANGTGEDLRHLVQNKCLNMTEGLVWYIHKMDD